MSTEIQTINSGQQLSVDSMRSHVAVIDEMTKAVMKSGMHYGVIPGCGDKPTLLQPGAQKLLLAFQLSVEPEVEWNDLPNGHREYHVKCHLISRANGIKVGTGLGNCSTMESRYRFRTQNTGAIVPQEYWTTRDPELLGGRRVAEAINFRHRHRGDPPRRFVTSRGRRRSTHSRSVNQSRFGRP